MNLKYKYNIKKNIMKKNIKKGGNLYNNNNFPQNENESENIYNNNLVNNNNNRNGLEVNNNGYRLGNNNNVNELGINNNSNELVVNNNSNELGVNNNGLGVNNNGSGLGVNNNGNNSNMQIIIGNINNENRNRNRLNNLNYNDLIEEIKIKKNKNQLNESNILVYLHALVKYLNIKTYIKETKNNNNLNSEKIMVEIKIKENKDNNGNNKNNKNTYKYEFEWGNLKNYRDQLNVLLDEFGGIYAQYMKNNRSEESIIDEVWKEIKKNDEKYNLQKNYILAKILKLMEELNKNKNFNKNSNNANYLIELQKILYNLTERNNSNKNQIKKLFEIINLLKETRSIKVNEIISNLLIYINSVNIIKSDMILGFLLNCTIIEFLDIKYKKTLYIDMEEYRKNILELFKKLF